MDANAAHALPPPTASQLARPALPPPPPGSAPPGPPAAPQPSPAPPEPPTTALVTGPAAVLSADPTCAPLEQSVPALPPATAVAPANTAASSLSNAPASPLTLDDLLAGQNGTKAGQPDRGSSVGRFFRRLLLVAVLAAGGYAAYTYGPDLYDQYVDMDAAESDVAESEVAETGAPLAFPNATPPAAPIRTAEFILEGLPQAPDMTYRVITDFETNVSQVDITRPVGPDLQILTYGDAALIRRSDDSNWYQLERGRFPLDDRLERSDWVRDLEELLPTAIRSSVTIDASGETTVSGVPTRHLSLTLDIALLGGAVDPTTRAQPVETAEQPDTTEPTTGPSTTSLTTSIEVWVDRQGIVRKVSGVPQLGAETITVVRTDGAAWVPDYPSPEYVQPLTAASLVELGI